MHIEHHIQAVQRAVRNWQNQGLNVGFVPTMGNLHDGHISLVEQAKQRADKVVVSIFVNPLQFGPNEDYDSYPRTLQEDGARLAEAGVDLLFAPSVEEMYPGGRASQTRVSVPGLGDILEGESRPGFFTGVATVVNKLFNCVPADVAVFGEKDYQQLMVIRRMASDLSLPIEIVGSPIVREQSGLAMSSRNGYLSTEQRQQAAALYQTLRELRQRIEAGERDYAKLETAAAESLARAGLRPDYLSVHNAEDLSAADGAAKKLVILAAARLGTTRLIDNISFEIQ